MYTEKASQISRKFSTVESAPWNIFVQDGGIGLPAAEDDVSHTGATSATKAAAAPESWVP
jgi:hypothetical protein